MAYTTASALKTYLGITANDDDTLLGTLVARAQKIVESYTGRVFEVSQDSTKYLDAMRDVDEHGRTLYLVDDLCAITSVTNGDGTAVAATEYVTMPRVGGPWWGLMLKQGSAVRWNWDASPETAIVVVGKWGYSTSAPADVVQATERLAAYLYRQRDNANDLDRAMIAGNTTILPQRLPSDIKDLLEPYRRIAIWR